VETVARDTLKRCHKKSSLASSVLRRVPKIQVFRINLNEADECETKPNAFDVQIEIKDETEVNEEKSNDASECNKKPIEQTLLSRLGIIKGIKGKCLDTIEQIHKMLQR